MILFVDLFEAFTSYVSVDLGGADVHMAQHHLNSSQVSPALEQMAGK